MGGVPGLRSVWLLLCVWKHFCVFRDKMAPDGRERQAVTAGRAVGTACRTWMPAPEQQFGACT